MLVALAAPAFAQQSGVDISIDSGYLQSSVEFRTRSFKANDCAVQEQCVTGTGKRNLMRFSVATPNIGDIDLYLGKPQDHPELFVYSPCHGHYHLVGYAVYELLQNGTTVVVTGHKQAFCLEDFNQWDQNAAPAKYTCSNQGISVGWQDIYGSYLDCQWIDVTGVAPGNYLLRVSINPARSDGSHLFSEVDYTNNVATVPITIPRRFK